MSRYQRLSELAEKLTSSTLPAAILILMIFILGSTFLLSLDTSTEQVMLGGPKILKPFVETVSLGVIVLLVGIGSFLYIHHFQPRIILHPARVGSVYGMLLIMLTFARFGSVSDRCIFFTVGSAVMCAMILTIAYNQRFALGMTLIYCVLACFSIGGRTKFGASLDEFVMLMAGVVPCCFFMHEIRKRMQLVWVAVLSALCVFIMSVSLELLGDHVVSVDIVSRAGSAAAGAMMIGVLVQAFLPLIERAFNIATSMTLMEFSDANQPLLRKLAMEAPGTFSHSLLIGLVSESAAESIGANGLLCRVGAYYHDIGKLNKPMYFVENQMGCSNRHDQLSPSMSKLVIVGHVNDGIEIAKEFKLQSVLMQFIETHHGTTLIEYFYNEALKKADDKQTVSESEFRYPGPKPQSKEAAIVMLADAAESAVRSLQEHSLGRIEQMVHNLAMKRLQDGQFDESELTLKDLSRIEDSLSKSLAGHYHGRIAYPKQIGARDEAGSNCNTNGNGNGNGNGNASKDRAGNVAEESGQKDQPQVQRA